MTNAQALEKIVTNHPFLQGMKSEHLKLLADSAMESSFAADELIFREGDPANRFYLLQEGRVALEMRGKEHSVIPVQIIGAGDVVGWSWLFPPYYWHFDARAVSATKAIFFYGTRLRERCEEDPCLGYDLMKRMAGVIVARLRATRHQLVEAQGLW